MSEKRGRGSLVHSRVPTGTMRSMVGWPRAVQANEPRPLFPALLGVAVALALWVGCRPAREVSEEAAPLPLVDSDSLEDGADVDCWPGFRGPGAQGIAPGGKPALHFNQSEGFRWKVEVPGDGWSSPVVCKDRVLLTSALDQTDPPTLAVLCYDRADGRLVWQADAGQAAGSSHNKNGYASASVVTDGVRIVAFFGAAGLFCYDLDGKPLWQADLGNLDHKWGTASSPVLHGDLVIQLCESEQDSYLGAFDKATGERRWRTPRAKQGCWSTPVVIEADTDDGGKRTEIVVNGSGAAGGDRSVTAYAIDDGRQLWQVRGMTEWVSPTPMVRGGLVFCTSGRNGPILAIRPGGEGDVSGTRLVWKLHRGGPYVPSGVVYRNRLYVVTEPGFLACYNAGDGQQVWRTRVRDTFTASLVAAAGRIYATSERGRVYVFAAGDAAEMLAENAMGARCQATPAVAGGELFIRTAKHLYCIPGE